MKKLAAILLMFALLPAFAAWGPEAPYEEHWREQTFDYRAEDPEVEDSTQGVSIPKTVAVGSFVAASYAAAYFFVFQKGWWGEQGRDFHFEFDFEYAKNLDKLGHFASGVAMGELFYQGYHWAGFSESTSYLMAGSSAFLTHVAIDIKDGFSPQWGFSIFDVMSGTLGGFYPMAKRYVPIFKYFDLKMSYWVNSHAYYNSSDTGVATDDYVNQTYWCSFKIYRMLPYAARRYYPEWLAFAVGLSIDDGVYEINPETHRHMYHYKDVGKYEVYLALDYDFEAFRPHQLWARNLVKALNYFKFPAPTLQVYPEVKFFLLYPIKF